MIVLNNRGRFTHQCFIINNTKGKPQSLDTHAYYKNWKPPVSCCLHREETKQ